jgi:hypothetical protein
MTAVGQSRRFDHAPITSGLPWKADMFTGRRDVSNVPKAKGRSGLVGLRTDDRQRGLTWFSVRIASAEILDAIGVLQALAFLAPRDAVLEGHNRLSMLNWRGLFSRRGLRGLLTGRWTNEECQQKEDGSASHLGTLTLKEAGRVRGLQC